MAINSFILRGFGELSDRAKHALKLIAAFSVTALLVAGALKALDINAAEALPPELAAGVENASFVGTVVIDPGHGGVQPGCVYGGIMEKEITLPVSLLVRDKLLDAGVEVIMTRETDEHVELQARADLANDNDADCFVSIHCNAFVKDASVNGLESYYFFGSEQGKLFSDMVIANAEEAGITTRYSREQNYLVIRETKMPAVLIELGYMTNPTELRNLSSEAYQERLADTIADSVLAFLDRDQTSEHNTH